MQDELNQVDKQVDYSNYKTENKHPMTRSRVSRVDESRTRKQFILMIVGIIALILFIFVVGIPLVVGASVFMGNLKSRGPSTDITKDTTAPYPPTLSPLATATNSAQLKLEGYGEAGATLTIMINGKEAKTSVLNSDGNFSFSDITLSEGDNTIYATQKDQAGNESNPSEEQKVKFQKNAPKLEITQPTEGQTFGKNQQDIVIQGKTDVGNQVHINDRFVFVKDDGSFEHQLHLSDGDNTITIIATDPAGNETKMERKVTYSAG